MMREVRDEGRAFRTDTRERLERVETLLDRVASMAFETRADVREIKRELREHFPAVQ